MYIISKEKLQYFAESQDRKGKMRTEAFTMERNVLEIGQEVEITEGRLPRAYYYTAEPAAAMSGNIPLTNRIVSKKGTVTRKTLEGSTFTVEITFDE